MLGKKAAWECRALRSFCHAVGSDKQSLPLQIKPPLWCSGADRPFLSCLVHAVVVHHARR